MAARNLTAAMLGEIVQGTVRPAVLYEGEFVSAGATETLRLWSGIGTLSWDAKSWTGAGNLMGISVIEETRDVAAAGFTVTMAGIAASDITRALAGVRQNRPGTLWLALLDSAGAVIADPYQLQRGRFDTVAIDDNGATCTITAQYEGRLVDLHKPRERRYTHEDQQIDYAGDLGFEYVPGLQDLELVWGGPGGTAPVAQIDAGDAAGGSPVSGGGFVSDGGVGVDSVGDDGSDSAADPGGDASIAGATGDAGIDSAASIAGGDPGQTDTGPGPNAGGEDAAGNVAAGGDPGQTDTGPGPDTSGEDAAGNVAGDSTASGAPNAASGGEDAAGNVAGDSTASGAPNAASGGEDAAGNVAGDSTASADAGDGGDAGGDAGASGDAGGDAY